jgi:hypothetical protein
MGRLACRPSLTDQAMNTTPELWAVYLSGSDEILAAPSKADAETRREALNRYMEEHGYPGDASVIPYPATPEDHAKEVLKWNRR